jgi:hypothetical protein
MVNEQRRLDLGNKFLTMGQALVKEGIPVKDTNIVQAGTIFIMLSSLILNDEDMFLFGEICAMFSAKKVLEDMEQTEPERENSFQSLIDELIKNSIEPSEQPKKIRKSRKKKDNGDSDKTP